jgi:putative colanic acid biosynthesis acetyltransferase WcaF
LQNLSGLWLLSSFVPGSTHRVALLRLFGARIGQRVTIKPGVRVKFPWRLSVGDNVWIGEDVWIDNLGKVKIGSDVCISQRSYICTGSHDWSMRTFNLIVRPITVNNCAWIGAMSTIGPGVSVGEGAVLCLHSSAYSDLAPWHIYQGVPATVTKARTLSGDIAPAAAHKLSE